MKSILSIIFITIATAASAQDFDKNLASARASYAAGKLEDSRFAMEQMLANLDAAIGKEILKLLPAQLGSMKSNVKEDNVTGSSAGVATGLFVHRTYGLTPTVATVEIINNSPLMNSIGMILNTPLMGGMMKDENQKTIKVQGYKSLLTKKLDSDTGKTGYELQIPMNNTLVTIQMGEATEAEITGYANAIPLAKIATLAQ